MVRVLRVRSHIVLELRFPFFLVAWIALKSLALMAPIIISRRLCPAIITLHFDSFSERLGFLPLPALVKLTLMTRPCTSSPFNSLPLTAI